MGVDATVQGQGAHAEGGRPADEMLTLTFYSGLDLTFLTNQRLEELGFSSLWKAEEVLGRKEEEAKGPKVSRRPPGAL